MDFFEGQERAQRSTGRLVLLFLAAVVLLVGLLNVLVATVVFWLQDNGRNATLLTSEGWRGWSAAWDPKLFGIVTGATLLIVVLGSFYKTLQLRSGGGTLAASLGGTLVPADTSDALRRRLLNVVEEMAIASGIPVPAVYVLEEEPGINAFAAGLTFDDAAVAVTRGSIEQLSRDELQAVVAHEFSHILNGDMRLNIRLIGIVHGILVIGLIGYYTFRTLGRGRQGGGRSRRKGGGSVVLAILAIALGLMVVGFAGTFFGNLIKAAINRQREYLADASAVQFTRNPDAFATALKRIGGHVGSSFVQASHAAEASHLFFAKALHRGFASLFSTHPPLRDRIRRVDPRWDGRFLEERTEPLLAESPRAAPTGAAALASLGVPGAARSPAAALATPSPAAPRALPVMEQVGLPTPAHVEYAQKLLAGIPEAFSTSARDPFGACVLVYALVIADDHQARAEQLRRLTASAPPEVLPLLNQLLSVRPPLAPEARLPLLELALSPLRQLSASQYAAFRADLSMLIRADARVSLFEWVLEHAVIEHVGSAFQRRPPSPAVNSLSSLIRPLSVVLSTLARAGHRAERDISHAFEAGRSELALPAALCDARDCGLAQLTQALPALRPLTPRLKKMVLRAAASTIAFDKTVTIAESELLRALADTLGCPMSPLLPGQPLV